MKVRILTISLLTGVGVALIMGVMSSRGLTKPEANRELSQREMTMVLGTCRNCTLGRDETKPCAGPGCGGCQADSTGCWDKEYSTGDYYTICWNMGIADGTCMHIGTVECARHQLCKTVAGPWTGRHCNEDCLGGSEPCAECEKGDYLHSRWEWNYACVCP